MAYTIAIVKPRAFRRCRIMTLLIFGRGCAILCNSWLKNCKSCVFFACHEGLLRKWELILPATRYFSCASLGRAPCVLSNFWGNFLPMSPLFNAILHRILQMQPIISYTYGKLWAWRLRWWTPFFMFLVFPYCIFLFRKKCISLFFLAKFD